MQFVQVDRRLVEFENGLTTAVEPFSVSKTCVTVRQFADFQKMSGYVTTAERSGSGRLFYSNEAIDHVSGDARLDQPAFCISFEDAEAFCHEFGFGIPTEAQWLAASLIDAVIYGSRNQCPLCDSRGRIRRELLVDAVELSQWEWTSTPTQNGAIVIRGGPFYFREIDWKECVDDHRKAVNRSYWDLLLSFRVVLS